ncbi:galactose mutarotase-like domain-containing protein [Gloeopeniophorella convolvens]|nr:galactose mutarotase-like domain-containing protein [Gloeopeniophorella convolvens]
MSDPSLTPLLLALPSLTPSLAAEILPRGLTLHRLFVQADGRTHDVVVGPEDPADHQDLPYTNTIVGRYANRVPSGTHPISRNGASATFTAVAHPPHTPDVSLHGGPSGFDAAEFEPIPLDAATPDLIKLFTARELTALQSTIPSGSAALFRHVSPDGDQGFPGELLVEVVVGLLPPQGGNGKLLGSVVFIYRAKLLDQGVTPINLTQHWGFNLDASVKDAADVHSVKEHSLTLRASHTVDIDGVGLPMGNLTSVSGTPHAHEAKRIGEQFPTSSLGEGYDHFYIFEERERGLADAHRIAPDQFTPELDLVSAVLAPRTREGVAELASVKSGLKLVFDTNQSGVQFYTYNFASDEAPRKKIHGGSGLKGPGEGYGRFTAAFLEFHEPLSAFLHPDLRRSDNDTLLGPGEVYNNFVRVDVLHQSE